MRRILLMGYFGADNLGDDMLLADWLLAHHEWLDKRELRVDVLSRSTNPVYGFTETPQLEHLLNDTLTVKSALACNPQRYAALIAPGGSLLQDTTSQRSLLFYLWLMHRFEQAGTPVFLLNQGIGPIHGWAGTALLPEVLARCKFLSVRDTRSLEMLRSYPRLKRVAHLHLSCDPILAGRLSAAAPRGFQLPYQSGQYLCAVLKGATDTESRNLANLLSALSAASGLPVLLLPLHSAQDQAFCELTHKKLGLRSHLLHTDEIRDSSVSYNSAMICAISASAFVLSHRLHGLVTAQSYGLPACGIAYDPKVSALCSELGLSCLEPKHLDSEDSKDTLLTAYESRFERMHTVAHHRNLLLARLASSEAEFLQVFDREVS